MSLIASDPAPETQVVLKAPQLPVYRVEITEEALASRKDAIELSQSIVSVSSVTERSDALAAVSLVKGLLKALEKTREEIKRPVLDAGHAIDKAAKGFADALKIEQSRVEKLLNEYQSQCNAAAEELRRQEMADIAQENAKAAQANDIEKLRENAQREAELNQKTVIPDAIHKQFFDYDILPGGLMELAQQRPDLVSIEPRRREILAAISNGALLPGLRVYKRTTLNAKAS